MTLVREYAEQFASHWTMNFTAVALYYLEDRPVDEIADLMEVSVSTVKQHLFQARGRLGELLAGGVVTDAE